MAPSQIKFQITLPHKYPSQCLDRVLAPLHSAIYSVFLPGLTKRLFCAWEGSPNLACLEIPGQLDAPHVQGPKTVSPVCQVLNPGNQT